MAISVRLKSEEEVTIKKYAALKNISVSELVRQAVLEKIEDEFDLAAYKKAKAEYKKNPVTYSHAAVVKMLVAEE